MRRTLALLTCLGLLLGPALVFAQAASKPLYLSGASQQLSRTPPAAPQANITIAGNNTTSTWTLTPPLAANLALPAQNVGVQLWLTRSGPPGQVTRNVRVTLAVPGVGTLGTSAILAIGPPTVAPQMFTFSVPIPATTIAAGRTITANVQNTTAQANRNIIVWPIAPGGERSNVPFDSNTVVNVDSVQSYNASFPGGAVTANFAPANTVFMRAVVSDPFGSFDIAGARVTLLDPSAGVVLDSVAMTEVADSGAATRTYELSYVLPGNAPAGAWTVRVVASEGTEGTVTDIGVGAFNVITALPTLVIAKTSQAISDPINNTTNPKRIPGSVQMYSVTITNQGSGTVDSSTLVITDPVPANTALFVSTASGDPVVFIDGMPPSGLTFNYAAHVTYSNQPGGVAPFTYTPVPDVAGFDPNVTGFRAAPAGTMNAASGAGNPSFTIRFRVRLE